MLLDELKGLPNTLNFLSFLILMAFIFYWRGKRKLASFLLVLTASLFLLASTPFLPRAAMGWLESSYKPFDVREFSAIGDTVLVHVLGAGYSLDEALPPNSQLALVTLGRLAEGLRICEQIPKSLLICSGYSSLGLESQASVVRRTAISIGFDSTRIRTLTTPRTTEEEARALAAFTDNRNVIVVTDASHMPRAIKLFSEQGFSATAAPTNYVIKSGPNRGYFKWLPSVRNITLTDRVLHELLGEVKGQIF